MRGRSVLNYTSVNYVLALHALYNFHEASGHHRSQINHHGEKAKRLGSEKDKQLGTDKLLVEAAWRQEASGMSSPASHDGI